MTWVNANIEPPIGERIIIYLTDGNWTEAVYNGNNDYQYTDGTEIDGWQVEYWMEIKNPHRPKFTGLRCQDCKFFNFHQQKSIFNNRLTYYNTCMSENVHEKNHCPSDEKCKYFKERERNDKEWTKRCV